MMPNGDRRSDHRRALDELKAQILKRYSSMDPADPDDRGTIQQARELIYEAATKLGIAIPPAKKRKDTRPDDETKVIERPA